MGRETKKARRQYRSGSIVSAGPGKWLVRVSAGIDPLTGKHRQRSRRVSGTRSDAEAAVLELRQLGPTPRPSAIAANATLNELIGRYLERGPALRPGTRRTYESLWSKWLIKGIGRRPAGQVDSYDYNQLWQQMAAHGLSASTMNNAMALIKGSYTTAAQFDEFMYRRERFVSPPKAVVVQREHPADEQLATILAALVELGEPWPFLVRLSMATGARRGEVHALRWNSLSDDNVLAIHHSVDFERGTFSMSNTKSNSPRDIALDEGTATRWRAEYKLADQRHRENFGSPIDPDAFVFASDPAGRTPRRPDTASKTWRSICDEIGLSTDVEFRGLRNWHATTLENDFDYSLDAVGRRLGHNQGRSKTQITQRYIATSRERDRRMAADVASRLAEIEALAQLRRLP